MKILKVIKDTNPFKFEVENWEGRKEIANVGAETLDKAKQIILNRPEPDKVKRAKDSKIIEIKNACARVIESEYWRVERYKTQLDLGVSTSETESEYGELLSQLENFRQRSNNLESEIETIIASDKTEETKIQEINLIKF